MFKAFILIIMFVCLLSATVSIGAVAAKSIIRTIKKLFDKS